jgi:hypothetical protein
LYADFKLYAVNILQSVYSFIQKDGEYLSGHEVFLRRVASAFNDFAETTERACREKYTVYIYLLRSKFSPYIFFGL